MTLESINNDQQVITDDLTDAHDLPSVIQEQATWNENFIKHQYSDVFSVTGCPVYRQEIVNLIPEGVRRILIPGCGCEPFLARQIIEDRPDIDDILAVDWSREAVRISESRYAHRKLEYRVKDTSRLAAEDVGRFDMVFIVNSVLSHSDLLNRAMLKGCYRVMKPGSLLYGLFPDILCSIEIGSMVTELSELVNSIVDLGNSTFFEHRQGMAQIYYTPQRLKRVLECAGFRVSVSDISRRALEGAFFSSEYERLYGYENADLCIWENEVLLKRP